MEHYSLTGEKDDLLASEPARHWNHGLQFGDEGIAPRGIRKADRHPSHRVDADSNCFHAGENACRVRWSPTLELADEFYLVVPGLGDALEVLVKASPLIQSPHHHGCFRFDRARWGHRCLANHAAADPRHRKRGRDQAGKVSSSQHAGNGTKRPKIS